MNNLTINELKEYCKRLIKENNLYKKEYQYKYQSECNLKYESYQLNEQTRWN